MDMDTKSLNCSVLLKPADGKRRDKKASTHGKEQKKHATAGEGMTGGKVITITYVPQKQQVSPAKSSSYSKKNTSRNEKSSLSGSRIEIEEFSASQTTSRESLKMNYVIDDRMRCRTCWELKYALDFTFQKLHRLLLVMEDKENNNTETSKQAYQFKNFRNNTSTCQHYCDQQNISSFSTKPIINETEESGPLMDFFSHLIRSVTINKMKQFSKAVEEKLSRKEKASSRHKNSTQTRNKANEQQVCKQKITKKSRIVDACESCQRFRQALYITVSKLYEEAGIKTDFPTVQTLETYAFLVYPSRIHYAVKNKNAVNIQKTKCTNFSTRSNTEPHDYFSRNTSKVKAEKRTKEENLEDEKRRLLRARIKTHKAVFAASKNFHIVTALIVSFVTITQIFLDRFTSKHPQNFYIILVSGALLFGCLYNLYLMLFFKICSFKHYFVIPFCWVLLALNNGKCADPLMPTNICDPKIHFMSHVYLTTVLLEYYVASGIHAVLVLEIHRFQRMPFGDLLKYSVFNLPLIIIVLMYTICQFSLELRARIKRYFLRHSQIS